MIKISTLFSLSPSAVGGGTLTDGVKNGTLLLPRLLLSPSAVGGGTLTDGVENGTLLLLSPSVVGRRTLTGGVENGTKGGVDTGTKFVVQTLPWDSFEVSECNGLCVGTSCSVLRPSLIGECVVFEDEGW